jgi:hypothetical protein
MKVRVYSIKENRGYNAKIRAILGVIRRTYFKDSDVFFFLHQSSGFLVQLYPSDEPYKDLFHLQSNKPIIFDIYDFELSELSGELLQNNLHVIINNNIKGKIIKEFNVHSAPLKLATKLFYDIRYLLFQKHNL